MREAKRNFTADKWRKLYVLDEGEDIVTFLRDLLESEKEINRIQVYESVEGDMKSYEGAYSKEKLLPLLDEMKNQATPQFDISVMIAFKKNQVEHKILSYFANNSVSLITPTEELDLNDIVKKNKTL